MKRVDLIQSMRRVTDYALPITAASLLNIVSGFFAMLIVARLGTRPLAASALAMPTFITINTIFATSLYAISILISHAKGESKSEKSIGKIVKNGLWLACLMALPSGFLLWHADKALILFGQDKQLIHILQPYFHYGAFSLFPMLLSGVIAQFYTGIGKPRFAMTTSLIRLPFIVLLSYGFILGRFGLPQLGLAGVMCASWIVQSVYTLILFIYLYFEPSLKSYELFTHLLSPSKRLCKKIFLLGIPIGLQFGGELAAMTVASYLVGLFGVMTLAAAQVVSQFSMFVVMVILGLSQALSVLISHAYAEKDFAAIRAYLLSTFILYGAVFICVTLIFLCLPHQLLGLYLDTHLPSNHRITQLTTYFFEVACVFLLFDGIRHMLAGALRGLHDSTTPMQIGIVCLWFISLPVSYAVGFHFHEGPIGLRLSFISGFVVASLLLFKRLQKQLTRMNDKAAPVEALAPTT